jgi:hypothetical protein
MPSIRVALVLLISAICVAQQLPDTATPENYQLSLAPDLQKKTFQGNETIRVRLFKPTPTVTLNAAEITLLERLPFTLSIPES